MKKIGFKRNVYMILIGIFLLAVAVQVTNSQFILQFNRNGTANGSLKGLKPAVAQVQTSGKSYCVLFDRSDEFSVKLKTQTENVLGYLKKPMKTFDVRSEVVQTNGCQVVISTLTNMSLIGNVDELAQYVKQGGYVFQETTPEKGDSFYRLYRKMGIVNVRENLNSRGIHLTSNVLIGEDELTINDPFIFNSMMSVELDLKSRVLAKSAEGVPLLWDYPYGQGKFMVFNGTMLQEKLNRGLIAGALGMLEPVFVYPIFNSKIVYLDDFPMPIANTMDTMIYDEYHKSRPAFFKDIWWPDMLSLAKKSDVKYTAVLIESYQQIVQPPFNSPLDKDTKGLVSYGREVLKSGGEIGLHGYNHQSLTTSKEVADAFEYVPWGSINDMTEATKEVIDFAKQAFPNYSMVSYVPPSNVLSPEGREALKKGWPTLAVISSLYPEDGSDLAYVQEYAIASDGILEMPRMTSGYSEGNFQRWLIANAVTTHGIFSHFIHPDDIISKDRSEGLKWDKMYKNLSEMLERVHQTYPWLRAMTSSEAAIDMEAELASQVSLSVEGNILRGKMTNFHDRAYFVARMTNKIGKLHGCKVEKIDTNTYLITASTTEFDIELGG
ncbi:DUF2194 domain-containing protein [Paenibacillus roseipurpureus]|uniref:DUF2194 domain-containing protein n=1 Tax=Paenibacillus roseopurpureus TaxID=2918901 RepID=A0AA96LMA1_9BACL|nr:DUF2194 domain-containing protein [Paenibacillus sp. MBLB1832]WNR42343.1 DUF2194 domain-containing protein [Paenibacillus sp. MBLB1832]